MRRYRGDYDIGMYVVLVATIVGSIFALDNLGDSLRGKKQTREPQKTIQIPVRNTNNNYAPFWELVSK